jgi:hypothetical protein
LNSIYFRAARGAEATQWAKEIAEYLNANYSHTHVQAYSEQFGAFGTLHWMSDFESMASMGEFMAQLQQDEDYVAITSRAADLVIEGSVHDTLMMSL